MGLTFASASSQSLSNAAAVLTAPPITMACWFNRTATGTSRGLMSLNTGTGADNRFTMAVTSAEKLIALARSTSNGQATSVTSVTANAWQHGCATFTSTTQRDIYLNGVAEGADTTSITPSAPTVTHIGRFGAGNFWEGLIAMAAIWAVVLSAGEIAALAKGVHPRWIRPISLKGFWPILGVGSQEPDLSGGGFHMTKNNTPTLGANPWVNQPSDEAWYGAFTAAAVSGQGQLLSGRRNSLVARVA